ncbi:hypothetical protein J2X03_002413 [Microbacterium trichothecenolyticum]|uniref:DUF2304 domain-containing protein n=1 Tax=Microbacterium trichothecenolyticum TaxID=69370 RepID=UPI00285FF077|nr:DUF2304 domain-containing protein [Microbacterium trichothecenolyticum]MDR7112518.1 hypothetical protein [Microbacterium trichothecenolyticum]
MIVFFGIALALVILIIVVRMLLTRTLREKYAVMWLVIGLAVLILGVFPQLLLWLTDTLGVQVPANLLFSLAIVLLLGVALHLSWELSQAEDEIRRLAEEAAISRAAVDSLTERLGQLEQRIGANDGDAGPMGNDR